MFLKKMGGVREVGKGGGGGGGGGGGETQTGEVSITDFNKIGLTKFRRVGERGRDGSAFLKTRSRKCV